MSLIAFLNSDAALVGVGLVSFGAIPEDRPGRFITVERTGGARDRLIDHPTFAVQVWAESRATAATLADLVADRIRDGFILQPEVAAVDVTTAYNWPDESGQDRYQLVVTAVIMQ